MDRRSFIATLIGGFAVATSGAALARSAPVAASAAEGAIAPDVAEALDQTDAEFTHMPPGPRWRAHRRWHRSRWRARRRRWRWRRGRRYYY